jgi:hypothetical protein
MDQPLVPPARRRTGVKNSGGTARDVVTFLVRLSPRISLTPGTGLPRDRSLSPRLQPVAVEATVRDLQVQTPAPGFLTGSHPKVGRHHGQPRPYRPTPRALSPGSNPGRNAAAPSPPRPAPARILTQRDHLPARPSTGCNELSLQLQVRTSGAPHRTAGARLPSRREQPGKVRRPGRPVVSGQGYQVAVAGRQLRSRPSDAGPTDASCCRARLPRHRPHPVPAATNLMPSHTSRTRPSRSR